MSTKLSISLNEELAELVKKEAKRTGRTVSEIFADAIRAYQKEKRREAYLRFKSNKKLQDEMKLFERAQLEAMKKLWKK